MTQNNIINSEIIAKDNQFNFSTEEKIEIFKKEIESAIKANGLNI